MKKIVDSDGNIIKNLYRTSDGLLVVSDKRGVCEYNKQLENFKKIQTMEKELIEMKLLLTQLMETKHDG